MALVRKSPPFLGRKGGAPVIFQQVVPFLARVLAVLQSGSQLYPLPRQRVAVTAFPSRGFQPSLERNNVLTIYRHPQVQRCEGVTRETQEQRKERGTVAKSSQR
jgi:hypothetical protein